MGLAFANVGEEPVFAVEVAVDPAAAVVPDETGPAGGWWAAFGGEDADLEVVDGLVVDTADGGELLRVGGQNGWPDCRWGG